MVVFLCVLPEPFLGLGNPLGLFFLFAIGRKDGGVGLSLVRLVE